MTLDHNTYSGSNVLPRAIEGLSRAIEGLSRAIVPCSNAPQHGDLRQKEKLGKAPR